MVGSACCADPRKFFGAPRCPYRLELGAAALLTLAWLTEQSNRPARLTHHRSDTPKVLEI